MPSTVRIQLLARFNVLLPRGQRAGPWGRPTARRLVQLLALREDHRIGREEAAELLFPDLSPSGAANGVAKALSMARSAIGPVGPDGVPALVSDRASIRVHDTIQLACDLGDLRGALGAALAMPPGDAREAALVSALATDATLLPEEPYASWAMAARQELEELRHAARLELARDRTRGHGHADPPSVAAAWTAVARQDPASEEAAIALMRVHAAAGQRDRAIRAYVQCVRALRSDLDAEPSAQLEAAYADVVARRDAATIAVVPGGRLPGRRLFGRQRTLARLRRSLAGTPAGGGPALLLLGPTGIGKSHLLGALIDELGRAGWVVRPGRSVPDDRRAPFAALRQALAPQVAADASAGPVLQRVVGLADANGDMASAETGEAARVTLTEELAEFLDRAAERQPLAVVLDDIQWADAAFHGLLRRLAARPGRRRWSLVLAARTDEPDAPPPSLGSAVESVPLPPLDPRATAAAVRAALVAHGERPRRTIVTAAVERSGGNPFFAIELARASAGDQEPVRPAPIPDAIVGLLRGRLQTVSAESRAMLSIVALAGADATYELVLRALDRLLAGGRRSAHVDLDELIGAQLVIEQGDRLALVHPLLGDAAVSTVNAVRRSAAHAAIAETLESFAESGDGPRREAAARHRLAAFEATRMQNYARPAAAAGFRAGRRARHVHAPEAALSLFAGALDAYAALPAAEQRTLRPDACAAWLTIGNIHLDLDDDPAAEAAYARARDLAVGDADVARAWSAVAGVPYRHGDFDAALAAYRSGVAALRGEDPRARARLESDEAWVLVRLGRPGEALAILRRVAPILLEAPETHLRCRTKDRLGIALAAVGLAKEGLAWLDDGVADATRHDDDRELMIVSLHRGELLADLGRRAEAEVDFERAAQIAEGARDRYMRAVIHWQSAQLHHARGDVERALAERDAEIEILDAIRNDRHLAAAQAHRAELLRDLGRMSDAIDAGRDARLAAERTTDPELAAAIGDRLTAALSGKDSGTARS